MKLCLIKFLNLREYINLGMFFTKLCPYIHRYIFFPPSRGMTIFSIFSNGSEWNNSIEQSFSLCAYVWDKWFKVKYVLPKTNKPTQCSQVKSKHFLFLKGFLLPFCQLQRSLWVQCRSVLLDSLTVIKWSVLRKYCFFFLHLLVL